MSTIDILRAIEADLRERAAATPLWNRGKSPKIEGRVQGLNEAADAIKDVADGLEQKEADDETIRRMR